MNKEPKPGPAPEEGAAVRKKAEAEIPREVELSPEEQARRALDQAFKRGAEREKEEELGKLTEERRVSLLSRMEDLSSQDPKLIQTVLERSGVKNTSEYINKNAKNIELKLRVLEIKAARENLVRAKKEGTKEEIEAAREKYETSRAEYVGEKARRMTKERSRIADTEAVQFEKEMGWGRKFYEGYKKLGEWNLTKLGWKPKSWLGKFVARTCSVRTLVSAGLVGAGLTLGGAATVGGLSLIMLRRGIAGVAAGFGSYDLMKIGQEKWAEARGLHRELSPLQINELSTEDILKRMEHFEINAANTGKRVGRNETYRNLQREWARRLEEKQKEKQEKGAERAEVKLKELMSEADKELEKVRKKEKRNDRVLKGIAVGLGAFAGSGALAKVTRTVTESLGLDKATAWVFGRTREGISKISDLFASKDDIAALPPSEVVAAASGGEVAAVNTWKREFNYIPPTEEAGKVIADTPFEPELPGADGVIEAAKGDSVGKMATRALHEEFGEKFDSLDPARKTYLIDAVKDRIVANPAKFGLVDPNVIPVGKSIDFNSAFNEGDFAKAAGLGKEELDNILRNNEALREWASKNPGEPLTEARAEEILRGVQSAETATADVDAGAGSKPLYEPLSLEEEATAPPLGQRIMESMPEGNYEGALDVKNLDNLLEKGILDQPQVDEIISRARHLAGASDRVVELVREGDYNSARHLLENIRHASLGLKELAQGQNVINDTFKDWFKATYEHIDLYQTRLINNDIISSPMSPEDFKRAMSETVGEIDKVVDEPPIKPSDVSEPLHQFREEVSEVAGRKGLPADTTAEEVLRDAGGLPPAKEMAELTDIGKEVKMPSEGLIEGLPRGLPTQIENWIGEMRPGGIGSFRMPGADLMVFKSPEGAISSIWVDSQDDAVDALRALQERGLTQEAIEKLSKMPSIGGKFVDTGIRGMPKLPQDYYFVKGAERLLEGAKEAAPSPPVEEIPLETPKPEAPEAPGVPPVEEAEIPPVEEAPKPEAPEAPPVEEAPKPKAPRGVFEEMEEGLGAAEELKGQFMNPKLLFGERMEALRQLIGEEKSAKIGGITYRLEGGKVFSDTFGGEVTEEKFYKIFSRK